MSYALALILWGVTIVIVGADYRDWSRDRALNNALPIRWQAVVFFSVVYALGLPVYLALRWAGVA